MFDSNKFTWPGERAAFSANQLQEFEICRKENKVNISKYFDNFISTINSPMIVYLFPIEYINDKDYINKWF